MNIDELLEEIRREPECKILPPSGQPILESPADKVPEDLGRFYTLCGGVDLFMERDYGFRVVPPESLRPASSIILPLHYKERKSVFDSDISSHWYLLFSSNGPEENIVIDLHPDRNGVCYDGYINTYASSDCFGVARSFSEVLCGIFAGKGEEGTLYWEGRLDIERFYVYESLDVEPPCG